MHLLAEKESDWVWALNYITKESAPTTLCRHWFKPGPFSLKKKKQIAPRLRWLKFHLWIPLPLQQYSQIKPEDSFASPWGHLKSGNSQWKVRFYRALRSSLSSNTQLGISVPTAGCSSIVISSGTRMHLAGEEHQAEGGTRCSGSSKTVREMLGNAAGQGKHR